MTGALVLFSGGKDSTVALTWASATYPVVQALSYDVPYRPRGELQASINVARHLSVPLVRVALPFLTDLASRQEHRRARQTAEAYVPHRNLVFHSIACHLAEANACHTVVAGHIQSDSVAYSDSSGQYLRSIYRLANAGFDLQHVPASSTRDGSGRIDLDLPLAGLDDVGVIRLGRTLRAPLELSWSCLEEGDRPCGACVSCQDRASAFAGAS